MQDPENDFSPLLIDQQIEQPATSLPRGEAHLIHDLQTMYSQEHRDAIDRVWTRLAQQQSQAGTFSQQQQNPASIVSSAQNNIRPVRRTHGPRQVRTFVRRLNLLVALLVVMLLVGSLTIVFALSRGGTGVGVGTSPVPSGGWGHVVYTQMSSDFGANGLAWSPDSKRVAVSNRATSSTNEVRIWDATTGLHAVNIPVNTFVNTIAWSPDSQQLAIATIQSVIIVNGQNGHVIRTLPAPIQLQASVSTGMLPLSSHYPLSGGPGLSDISWSPDGNQLAASLFGGAAESSVVIWDMQSKALKALQFFVKAHNGIEGISWSSDGKFIAADTFQMTGTDPLSQRGIVVWNVDSHAIVLQKNTGSLPDLNVVVAWQPGTHNLAQIGVVKVGNDYASAILLIDGLTGQTLKQLVVSVSDVLSWSPDGKYLAYTGPVNLAQGNTVRILNASNWSTVYTYKDGTNSVNDLAWSPNGHYIVTGETIFENNVATGTVKVWTTLD